jgi:hypothetical protein
VSQIHAWELAAKVALGMALHFMPAPGSPADDTASDFWREKLFADATADSIEADFAGLAAERIARICGGSFQESAAAGVAAAKTGLWNGGRFAI